MQSNIKRLFSLALALIMVLSCVPVMAFAAEDTASATYVAENTTTGVQYADLNEAITAAQAGQIVQVLADSAESVVYNNEGVILDLNGHDLSNVTVPAEVTLSAIDSATDDYEGSFGTLTGTVEGQIAATVKTSGEVKSYVTVTENGSYSFHRYYAAIAAISLKPAQAALGYRAEFRGDEVVKNAVVGYGYELWLNGGAHKAYSRTDALENSSLTLRLKNILAEGNDSLNALGSTATIGGNAFITLNLGGEEVTLYGTEQETTLRQVVESVNANVASYGEAQLEPVRTMCTTYAAWMEGWATDAIFGLGNAPEVDGDLKVEITVDVTAENNVLTQDATLSNEDISVTVPQGTVLENGTTQLVLTITEKASTDSNVSEEEGYTLLPLDVHIQGISADNTTPIIVCLGEVLPKGLNIGNYELYHVESGETVAMTRVYSVEELDTHNEFYYDPATGAVTVAMASFSEITLRSTAATWNGSVDHSWYNTTDTTLYIYNADQLWSFSQIVGGMAKDEEGNAIAQDSFEDKTVILYTDIDLNDLDSENGYVFYPVGYYNSEGTYEKSGTAITSAFKPFKGTFDGNGHTIANFYQNTWEMKGDHNWYDATEQNYRDGMGLFGKVYGGTVKNLTVKNFSSDGEIATTGTIAAYADCGATFENITIFNCNPRVYNIGNGGIVGCVGWYNNEETDENPVTFKNITVDNTNKISALWGSWDVACGGLVGQYYPTSGQTNATDNAGIYMENCHVTAQIDVNNDVCANYQYYAYRYAGILIGSVRENVTVDGRVYPNMDGITAKDCTVGFGDWNDYYYCELVANSQASYTHDYQMSRLEQVASVDVNNKTVTTLEGETVAIPAGRVNYVVVEGDHATDHATCYHFVDGAVWNHENAGYEDSIDEDGDGNVDLKEDKQHIYLEFNNLVTGYGWGVTSKGVEDMDGVTILDKEAAQKFGVYVDASTTQYTGVTITLGDLFKESYSVNDATVQAFVSPVGEDSTVTATYVADKEDWQNGTLTFHGKGAAEIIITDYYFCIATTLSINVENPVVRYWDYNSVSSVDCGDNGVVLPTADAEDGKTFIGWSEEKIAKGTVAPEVITDGTTYYPQKAVTDLYAVYSYTGSSNTTYTLVTDASTLAAGDVVVIANNDVAYALGTTQNSNNRAGVAITDNGDNTITINETTVQLLTLTAGETSGTFGLYTGSGYLYAAASGSNHLKTQTTNDVNGYWTITITDEVASIVATASSNRNVMQYNPNNNNPIFSCYSSASQTALKMYKQTVSTSDDGIYYESLVITACPHNNQETVSVDATCQAEGSTTVTCNDCREVVSEETTSVIAHNYVDGTCDMCGDKKAGEWVLVTDVNQLTIGDKVVIAAAGSDVALSTTQNNNNRGQVSITKGDGTVEINESVQVLILENGTTDGTYAFNTGSGYLYAASSSSNYLRTESTLSDNGSWIITIDAEGIATVKAQGTNSRNWLRKNSTSELFSCYASGQDDISIYRYAVYCQHTGEYTEETVAPTCTEAGYSYKVCSDCNTQYDITEGETATGHSYEEVTTAATCTEDGVKTFTCSNCDDSYTEVITATGHSYVDGTCSVCGAAKPSVATETMSIFGNTGTLASDSLSISWSGTNFTFTNEKGSSSTAIRTDDANHYRLYTGSSATISANNNQQITQLVFTCTSESYAEVLSTSIGTVDGATVTLDGMTVTVVFSSAVSSFTISSMTAQTRISSIAITYEG